MRFFRKKEIIHEDDIYKRGLLLKCFIFVIGAFISAISFNLFYVPNNFVGGGLGGIAIILNEIFNVNINTIILFGNILFVILSFIFLGKRKSIMGLVGAFTYILFVYVTEDIGNAINFSFDNVLLYVLAAGVVGGFGEALVYKAGFNTGGTSIPALIIHDKTKVPLGKILRIISIVIVTCGGITFGYTAIMYSLIISTISSYIVDKILIGISDSKILFIKTNKEDDVKDFIMNEMGSGVTEIDTKGSFTHNKQKMLMCMVATERYSVLKSAIEIIDPSAFIIVCDCYEVFGGTKKSKINFES